MTPECMGRMNPVVVRPLEPGDDLALLTDLIHAAYAPHAADGHRYWATHQSVEDTARRFAEGQGFVAGVDGTLVGTVTLRPPQPRSPVPLYRDDGTWSFGQFAVSPSHKGRGVGRALHDHILRFAESAGARVMALDTAATAGRLIAMYRAWGYEICGHCDWRPHTNYESVLMSRTVSHPGTAPHAQ